MPTDWVGACDIGVGALGAGAAVRRVFGVIAAMCMIGSLAVADEQGGPGAAQDTGDGAKVLLFSGADLWRNGGFVHGGVVWSPDGLDRDGLTFKLLVGGGTYRYESGALGAEVTGRQFLGSAMAGWRFKIGGLDATAFVGPDMQDHKLTPNDPTGSLHGLYLGVRGGIDLWYEPTAATMAAVNASGSTAVSEYSLRGAFGWRLLDRLYVGPEAQVLGSSATYRQLRLGLHATGLKLGAFEWSAGGGWVEDSDHRSGAYGHLGVLTRY